MLGVGDLVDLEGVINIALRLPIYFSVSFPSFHKLAARSLVAEGTVSNAKPTSLPARVLP